MSVSRSGDWWNWKVPTLLASGYASWLSTGVVMTAGHLSALAIVVSGLVIGAIFASVVNDFFDVDDDFNSGKTNRLASFSPFIRIVILCLVIFAGWLYGFLFIKGTMSGYCYFLAWVSFSVYSVPPFRTKKRGALGGLFDALGAGFFPTMFVAYSISEVTGGQLSGWFQLCLGIWSLVFGLRGILWHQYQDLRNDSLIGARTFATRFGTERASITGMLLLLLELSFFMAFMFPVAGPIILWIFVLYLGYASLVSRVLQVRQVIMCQQKSGEAVYFPGTFYQILWPFLLILLIPADPNLRIVLVIMHVILFRADLRINYYHVKRMVYAIPFVRAWLIKWRGGLRH